LCPMNERTNDVADVVNVAVCDVCSTSYSPQPGGMQDDDDDEYEDDDDEVETDDNVDDDIDSDSVTDMKSSLANDGTHADGLQSPVLIRFPVRSGRFVIMNKNSLTVRKLQQVQYKALSDA